MGKRLGGRDRIGAEVRSASSSAGRSHSVYCPRMRFETSRAMRLGLLALAVAGAIAGLRAGVSVPRGLTAQYFTTTDRSGPPSFSTVDAEISTEQISRRWHNAPPESFSV